jgi:hypothetical protein
MTRSKHPDRAAEILECLPEISERVSYIDTLQVWLASPLSPNLLDFLDDHSGGVRIFTGTLRNRPD